MCSNLPQPTASPCSFRRNASVTGPSLAALMSLGLRMSTRVVLSVRLGGNSLWCRLQTVASTVPGRTTLVERRARARAIMTRPAMRRADRARAARRSTS